MLEDFNHSMIRLLLNVTPTPSPVDSSESDVCFEIYKLYNFYAERAVFFIGFVLNVLNSLVFFILIRSEKKFKCDMFKYLFLKSILDAYFLLRGILLIAYDCNKCWVKNNYFWIWFYWIFVFYLGQVAALFSMFCEIGASFNRYRTISQHFQFMTKLPFKLVLAGMLAYCLLFYSYKFMERDLSLVTTRIGNTTHNQYRLRYNSFGSSNLILNVEFVHSLVRDCICVVVILIINMLTLFNMKRSLGRKRRLTTLKSNCRSGANTAATTTAVTLRPSTACRADQAENKITFMVITTGVLACIGHGLIFVYSLPWLALQMNMCLYSFANFVYYLSFGANFFIYYFFNKSFRRVMLLKVFRFECVERKRSSNRSSAQNLHDSSLIELRQFLK